MSTRLVILVAAHLAAAPLLNWLAGDRQFPEMIPLALAAETDAQLMLVGIWFCLGRRRLLWRVVALVTAVLILTLFWTWRFHVLLAALADWNWETFRMFFVLFVVEQLGIALLVTALRRNYVVARLPTAESEKVMWQFSLRQLGAGMLLTSVLLALGKFMREQESAFYTGDVWDAGNLLNLAAIATARGLVALAATWMALCPARYPAVVPIMLAAAIGAVLGGWLAYCEGFEFQWLADHCLQDSFAAALVAGSLLVVRSSGWRLVGGGPRTGNGSCPRPDERSPKSSVHEPQASPREDTGGRSCLQPRAN